MNSFFYDHGGKIIIFLVISVIGAVVSLANMGFAKECQIKAEGLSMEYEYSFFAGCRLKHDGKLIPLKNYRFNEKVE